MILKYFEAIESNLLRLNIAKLDWDSVVVLDDNYLLLHWVYVARDVRSTKYFIRTKHANLLVIRILPYPMRDYKEVT